jgi:hypothetical protein
VALATSVTAANGVAAMLVAVARIARRLRARLGRGELQEAADGGARELAGS